jgi:hypothetical protein
MNQIVPHLLTEKHLAERHLAKEAMAPIMDRHVLVCLGTNPEACIINLFTAVIYGFP